MPTRPAVHRPHFAKSPEQLRQDQRARNAERPSAAARGYDGEWRVLRAAFLVDHPTCCVPGCGRPAVDVDHIEDVRAHPARRLDPTNLRPYCHAHHSQRTAREQGFARREGSDQRVSTYAALHPDWLRPSRVALHIVCGPPGAGKTTYVAQHADFTELILDLEEIRRGLTGLPPHHPSSEGWADALRHRNAQLGRLSAPYIRLGGAWLTLREPLAERRLWWRTKLRPIALIVLATPAAECHARIDADPAREAVKEQHHQIVESWWRDYCPLPGERTVTPTLNNKSRNPDQGGGSLYS